MHWLYVAILVFCVGCKKKDPNHERAQEVLPRAEELRTKACACTDATCAAAVAKDVEAFRTAEANAIDAGFSASRELQHALAVAAECRIRLIRPPAPPPKPGVTDARAKVDALKDRMCKCADRDCARLVVGELTRLRTGFGSADVTDAQPRALHDSYIELVRCMSLAVDSGGAVLEAPAGSAR